MALGWRWTRKKTASQTETKPDPRQELDKLRAALGEDDRPVPSAVPVNPLTRLQNAARELQALDEQAQQEEMKRRLQRVTVVAFVGPSGTGKSTQAIRVSREYSIDYIIDDGLLIHGTSIVAGTSAKRSATRIDSVRQAMFMDETRAKNMRRTLAEHMPVTLMILGTSDSMLDRICDNLWLNRPSMLIRIEEVTSEEERRIAKRVRITEGQHTIPVPSMEIKHEFSGYFQDYLDRIRRRTPFGRYAAAPASEIERTVVRPTFSSLGRYSISDEAMKNMISFILREVPGVSHMVRCEVDKQVYGVAVSAELALYFGHAAKDVLAAAQEEIASRLEQYTSINVLAVNVRAVRVIYQPRPLASATE